MIHGLRGDFSGDESQAVASGEEQAVRVHMKAAQVEGARVSDGKGAIGPMEEAAPEGCYPGSGCV